MVASDQSNFRTTLGDLLDRAVQQHRHGEAVVFPELGVRLTYSQFGSLVDQAAKGLMALGIHKGEHIAIWSPNSHLWLTLQYAAAKVGAVLVTVNTYFKASEVEYVLKQSDSTTLFLASGFRDVDYPAVLRSICPWLFTIGAEDQAPSRLPLLRQAVFLGEGKGNGLLSFRELLELGRQVPNSVLDERQRQQSCDDIVTLVYTSGTTGFPKGALIAHTGIAGIAYYQGQNLGLGTSDRCCQPAPLFGVGGMLGGSILPFSYGATTLGITSFDPVVLMKIIQNERCTTLFGVPTMFIAILDHPDFPQYDLSSLKNVDIAGAPCPLELMNALESRLGVRVQIACGLTEVSGGLIMTGIKEPPEIRLTSVGRPCPGMEVKVIDSETGEDLPPGRQGELCYRGWSLMKGYYKMPEATGATIDAHGWLHSGDLATVDQRGDVRLTGRLKDMIIRGGQNIYSREIEEYLHTYSKVSDAYIVGLPDRKYGEELLACLRLKPGQECGEDDIREYCRRGLARFKVPKYVMFMDSFPMTALGKVQKFKLVEMGIARFGLERKHGGAGGLSPQPCA